MWVLVAIYLAKGALVPEHRHEALESKAKCQEIASTYVKQSHVGQAWAFCAKVRQ